MTEFKITEIWPGLAGDCGRCCFYGLLRYEITTPLRSVLVCDPCADEARKIVTERNGGDVGAIALKQEPLIKPSSAEVTAWKNELSDLVSYFVKTEEEKKAADAEFAERLNATWKQIQRLEAQISGAK